MNQSIQFFTNYTGYMPRSILVLLIQFILLILLQGMLRNPLRPKYIVVVYNIIFDTTFTQIHPTVVYRVLYCGRLLHVDNVPNNGKEIPRI